MVMKRTVLRLHSCTILLFVVIANLSGCATTKPNTPFTGPYPPGFKELSAKNPLLANELGKLPEIQDGIFDNEKIALEQIVLLYERYPNKFDDAFNEMYKIGLPGHRKYCSPLQALFWLAEDKNLSDEYINEYSLPKLLGTAWKEKKITLTDDQALKVIKGIRDKKIKNQFFQYIQNGVDEATINTILAKYKNRPYMFSWSARKIIKKALSPDPRWSDIDAVIDRFNSPELFDFYINRNIAYATSIPAFHRSPRSVIKEKYGDCDDLANFGKIVLTKAGYDVFGRILEKPKVEPNLCHIGLGIRLEDGSYLLAVDFGSGGDNRMSGPYKTLYGLDQALSRGVRYQKRGPFYFNW